MDGLILSTKTWVGHLVLLRDVLASLKETNLTPHPTKCEIAHFSLDFLGHRLSQESMSPSEAKFEQLRGTVKPQTKLRLEVS